MNTLPYPNVKLRKSQAKRLQNGHLWIFSNQLCEIDTSITPGSIVSITDSHDRFYGLGFFNPHSLIAIRILSRTHQAIDHLFFQQRLEQALYLRRFFIKGTNALRLLHSESDGFPGLIMDKYNDTLVIQFLSAGMEYHRDLVISTILKTIDANNILLRNDHSLRTREGLSEYKEWIKGGSDYLSVPITENTVEYNIFPYTGQKTGFYIDQRDHRRLFRHWIQPGNRVMDAFCHDGGFSMNALLSGAAEVLAIDNSETALEKARDNCRKNNLPNSIIFKKADAMKLLPELAGQTKLFDVINLDPPNFASNKKSVSAALRAYRKLHRTAFNLLRENGILATSCCSHHVTEQEFEQTIINAAKDTGVILQKLYRGNQPADHPILPSMPETAYLKFFIFRKLRNF